MARSPHRIAALHVAPDARTPALDRRDALIVTIVAAVACVVGGVLFGLAGIGLVALLAAVCPLIISRRKASQTSPAQEIELTENAQSIGSGSSALALDDLRGVRAFRFELNAVTYVLVTPPHGPSHLLVF